MKALSIIGFFLSIGGIYLCTIISKIISSGDIGRNSDEGHALDMITLMLMILFVFFLAFSITAAVVSFRKKKPQPGA